MVAETAECLGRRLHGTSYRIGPDTKTMTVMAGGLIAIRPGEVEGVMIVATIPQTTMDLVGKHNLSARESESGSGSSSHTVGVEVGAPDRAGRTTITTADIPKETEEEVEGDHANLLEGNGQPTTPQTRKTTTTAAVVPEIEIPNPAVVNPSTNHDQVHAQAGHPSLLSPPRHKVAGSNPQA